ncbi:MAG: hypothetical protein QW084_01710 [Candidatus Hadarchaeales archaeon]
MELRVLERKENPLVEREEVRLEVLHPGEPTPSREAVRSQLASQLGADGGMLVIWRLRTHQGSSCTRGLAHLYRSEEVLRKFAPRHLLQRGVKKEEKAGAKEEKAEAGEEKKEGGEKGGEG